MAEIENGRIGRTDLGVEDHGIMTCSLMLEFDGSCQSFGGWALDEPVRNGEGRFLGRQGSDFGMEFVKRVLSTLGAARWEDLTGMYCRAKREEGRLVAIGHVVEDRWFEPGIDLAHMLVKEPAA